MGQLELDLYPYRSKTISKGENQIKIFLALRVPRAQSRQFREWG